MNSYIRLRAKILLCGNTGKLFFVSLTSFILRYLAVFGFATFVLFFIKDTIPALQTRYGFIAPIIFFIPVTFIFCLLTLSFVCAIKSGENYIYYKKTKGEETKFLHLFRFLKTDLCFKNLVLVFKTFLLKTLWIFYFFIPLGMCILFSFWWQKNQIGTTESFFVLLTGTCLVTSFSLVLRQTAILRYCATPFLFFSETEENESNYLEKSISLTDGALTDGIVLKYSFIGWVLSCIFIVPLIYVVPYIKLTRALYVDSLR